MPPFQADLEAQLLEAARIAAREAVLFLQRQEEEVA